MTLPETPIEVSMPPGSVIITPAQIYAEVREMSQQLNRLTTMLDPALTTLRDEIGDVRTDMSKEVATSKLVHDDHESRLRSLDRRVWIAAVIAAGSAAGLTQLAPLLSR